MEFIVDINVDVDDSVHLSTMLSEMEIDVIHPLLSENYSERLRDSNEKLINVKREFEETTATESNLRQMLEELVLKHDQLVKICEHLDYEVSSREQFVTESGGSDLKSNMDDLSEIDIGKKLLNSYKRLLKFKWLQNSQSSAPEGLLFNDITAYLQHVVVDETCNPERLWIGLKQACDSSWLE